MAEISDPQYIHHVVAARFLALAPECGFQRAAHEDRPIGREVAQHDALAVGREQHVMFADDIAAPDGGKSDIAAVARAGDAVATRNFGLIKVDAPALRCGLAQHQGGARWGIDLHAVVGLDDFDIPIGVECCGDLLRQAGQQVDAKAHVASLNDHRMMRGEVEFGVVLRF